MPTTLTPSTATPTEQTGQYEELAYDSAALAPYWPSRIDEDLTWHGHKAQPGHWFLEPDTGTLLTITTSDAFTITAVPSREIDTGDTSPAPEPVFEPTDICGLAALLEDHYLLLIPPAHNNHSPRPMHPHNRNPAPSHDHAGVRGERSRTPHRTRYRCPPPPGTGL